MERQLEQILRQEVIGLLGVLSFVGNPNKQREFNRPAMQMEVRDKIKNLNLSLIGLLENKIKPGAVYSTRQCILPSG